MKKLFYDLETTGLNHKLHCIHHLHAVMEIDDKIVGSIDLKIKPHEKAHIDESALIAGNVTKEQIMGYIEQSVQFLNFRYWLNSFHNRFEKTDKIYLVGFNNRKFDDLFLEMFFALNKDDFMYGSFWEASLDSMVLAAEYLGERRLTMPSFKLKRVAMEVGIVVEESKLHEAGYDVYLTREIYRIVTGKQIEI